MKKEKLFRALADIGDDLIEMAEKRSFAPNMWRKWAALAASIALVLSLSVLALPYLPMGCGSASMEPESDNVEQESVIEDAGLEENAIPEEAPEMDEAPVEEEVGSTDDTDGLTLVFDGRLYNVTKRFVSDELTEQEVGEYLGVVEDGSDEAWIGCPVYSYGENQKKAILVKLPDEYLYCTLPLE